MRQYFPYIGLFMGALLIAVLQSSVLPVFQLTRFVQLGLVAMLFGTMTLSATKSFYFSIFLGLFFDLFAYLPFGTFIAIYLICWGISMLLQRNVLTAHSLLSSVVLMGVLTLIHAVLVWGSSYIAVLLTQSEVPVYANRQWVQELLIGTVSTCITLGITYLSHRLWSRRFNKVFIAK